MIREDGKREIPIGHELKVQTMTSERAAMRGRQNAVDPA